MQSHILISGTTNHKRVKVPRRKLKNPPIKTIGRTDEDHTSIELETMLTSQAR